MIFKYLKYTQKCKQSSTLHEFKGSCTKHMFVFWSTQQVAFKNHMLLFKFAGKNKSQSYLDTARERADDSIISS